MFGRDPILALRLVWSPFWQGRLEIDEEVERRQGSLWLVATRQFELIPRLRR